MPIASGVHSARMRYQDVGARFEEFARVRAACSREWKISATLVMCAELDMSTMTDMLVCRDHSQRHPKGATALIRVSYHRTTPAGIRSWTEGDAWTLDGSEYLAIQALRREIYAWVRGERDSMPGSTSSRIAERLSAGA